MTIKKTILAAALAAFAAAGLWAQEGKTAYGEGTAFEEFPSALGAYACYPIGGGLTYQRWLGRAGFEVTLGAIAQTGGTYNYNAMGAFQYLLYGEDFAPWFSGGLYTNAILAHRATGSTATGYESYSPSIDLGLGVGIEMVFLRHLSTSVEFMYVGSYAPPGGLSIDFGFGGSLKYRF